MNRKEHWLIPIVSKHRNGKFRRSDLFSQFVRCVLFCFSLVYRLIIDARNWAYDNRLLKVIKVATPVISVGNLTTGGTGKTPLVMWLIEHLHGHPDCKAAVVSRGYKTQQGSELNDEGKEIALRFPGIQLAQNKDRVIAANSLIQSGLKPPLIILDDGFQHRRLHRDLDIVLIDATNPFGYGHLIPRGLLREPIRSLKRADVAILTRSNLINEHTKSQFRDLILSQNPKLIWAESKLVFENWQSLDKKTISLADLQNKKVAAFCGIGNPKGFEKSLKETGVDLCRFEAFPDHHHFTNSEINQVIKNAVNQGCHAVVCTGKDLVKIPPSFNPEIPLYALVADVELTIGERELIEQINGAVRKS